MDAVDARSIRRRRSAERPAAAVHDRHLHVAARGRLQVVVDRRAARRVFTDEQLLPAGVLPALLIVEVRNRRTHVEDRRVLRLHGGRELLQRRDVVGDVDAASVRRHDQVAVARVHEDVVGAYGGIVGHELLPLLAAVERNVQAELGADVEQILVLRILADDLYVAERRQVARDALERRAVIARDEDVGLEIVVAVAVHRHVGRPAVEVRRVDA